MNHEQITQDLTRRFAAILRQWRLREAIRSCTSPAERRIMLRFADEGRNCRYIESVFSNVVKDIRAAFVVIEVPALARRTRSTESQPNA